jgi:hypothetical protein
MKLNDAKKLVIEIKELERYKKILDDLNNVKTKWTDPKVEVIIRSAYSSGLRTEDADLKKGIIDLLIKNATDRIIEIEEFIDNVDNNSEIILELEYVEPKVNCVDCTRYKTKSCEKCINYSSNKKLKNNFVKR